SHRHQPGGVRARRVRRLPRHLERDPGAAHAADEPYQRHFERDHRRRHPRRRAHRRRLGLGARRHRCGACLGERRRRLPRDAAHAADVQEKAEMTANQLTLWYLVASICFILALKGLSSPTTARRGNYFGMAGMAIAVLTTIAVVARGRVDLILIAMLIGGTIGSIVARRVQMTQMPELVAAMHSLVGMAAVLIAIVAVNHPAAFGVPNPLPRGNKLELFIGTFVGAITFSGSVIAFGKLAGLGKKFRLFSSAPVVFPGQHWLNLVLGLVMIGFGVAFFLAADKLCMPFVAMTAIAFALGVLIIIPIGGADMPVVISMLNSYSGWAAAGIGFSLNNAMLIIAGSLVGSSGAILSYIMCKAMNRSFFNVLLGGFGGAPADATPGGAQGQRPVKSGSADDAAFLMGNAETVIIVPGY